LKRIIILTTLVVLSSCSDGKNSELLGTWETDACEEAPAESGSLQGSWGKGIYEFSNINTISMSLQLYADSTCVEKINLISLENDDPLLFHDYETTTLQEGIEGHHFSLFFGASDLKPIEGFYTINNSKLCFSDNINFNPFSVTSAGSELTNIDFEKCLAKQ
jgi:hypothetical protein